MINTIHLAGTVTTQYRWAALVIWYLFLGGLGAALIAIGILTDLYFKPSRTTTQWAILSGEVAMAIGSILLLFHLLNPLHVWRILLPWNVFLQPTAWISWGTQFLVWAMIFGILYLWPILWHSQGWRKIPMMGWWFEIPVVRWSAKMCEKWQPVFGWLSVILSLGVAAYTGLLLRSFPAVALWHNPVIPLLFTVSAISTGLAYLLVIKHLVVQEHDEIAKGYEKLDLLFILIEGILLALLFGVVLPHSISGRASSILLMNNAGWIIGFLIVGLALPFVLELKGVFVPWRNSGMPVLAGVAVLVGGFLLRHYMLHDGAYYFPWSNAHHLGTLGSDVIQHPLIRFGK